MMIIWMMMAMLITVPATAQPASLHLYRQLFEEHGRHYGIDPKLLEAIGRTESGLDPTMTGAAGEYGMMQILPSTARAMGLRRHDAYKPDQNIRYAARFLAQNLAIIDTRRPGLSTRQRTTLLIASYNSGVGGALSGHYRQSYVNKVKGFWLELGGDYSDPTYQHARMHPLADLTLNEVMVEDGDGSSDRFLLLTFQAQVNNQVRHAELIVYTGCLSTGQSFSGPVTEHGSQESPGKLLFTVRVPINSDFHDCWADVRLKLGTSSGSVSWPWFGIVDPHGYPVERFPF